tara:strand:- start:1039 stop:2340 length:1302 start_codon:yes stop_codon:yes gene_type:complete
MATITRSVSQSFTPSESLSITISIWAYVNSHSDTLSLTDSGLSKSVSTFRKESTLTDSFSNSESLSKVVSTFRQESTLSDSFSNSESLNRAVDTWRHVLSFSMSLSPSESFSKAVSTYRQNVVPQDSLSTSDSLSLNTDVWRHVLSNADSLTPSESLSVSVSLWFKTFTQSDAISLSDGLTIQLSIANDTYFYDTYNMSNATKLVGFISSGNFTSDTSRVVNEAALYDGGINISTIYKGSTNSIGCVVFDFGSQVTVDFGAIYVESSLTNPITIYGSNSQGTGYTAINIMHGSSSAWQISDTNEFTYRYYAIQIEGMSSDVKIGEVLIGKTFKPEVRFDIGSTYGSKPELSINESLKGNEYAFKTKEPTKSITRQYSNISSSLKSEFESLWSTSSEHKFLYFFEDTIYYVLSNPINISEVSYNRYSTNYTLTE